MRFALPVLLSMALLPTPASGQTTHRVVIPNVSAFVLGKNAALYGTEVRFYNPTSTPKRFEVVDWIGTEGWKPFGYTVAPGGIMPISGWTIFNGDAVVTGEGKYGAAVCEIDDGLIVLSRMLQATIPTQYEPLSGRCPEWLGGANAPPPGTGCVTGIGPTLEFSRDFFHPGETMEILALDDQTLARNRTNLVIINPDLVASAALVQVHDSYGRPYEKTFEIPARTYYQVNDLYSLPEFRPLAVGGGGPAEPGRYPTYGSPSRAAVRCTTRCYAMGYVVSNFNNTVSASAPR